MANSTVIVYDSDRNDKPEVREAESRLAQQLINRGARVKVCRLPDGPNGAKQGLDDFLVARSSVELRKLIDKADDPDPVVERSDKLRASKLDAMPEARRFIQQVCTVEKQLILRYWHGAFYGHDKTHYVELIDDEIHQHVIQWLDAAVSHLTRSAVSNVLACVQAETQLSSRAEMPSWIGGGRQRELIPVIDATIELAELMEFIGQGRLSFEPRPDQPERFDEQSSFYHSKLPALAGP